MTPVKLTNTDTGIPFVMHLIRKGDSYGLNDCLTHDKDTPLVEFYDARFAHEDIGGTGITGQFVSRYYVTTLMDSRADLEMHGLTLDGGADSWRLNDRAIIAALFVLEMETTT